MKASSIYSTIAKSAAKTATLAALAVTALVSAATAQARPHYYQDVQYVQGGAQLVISPPQLVIQAPLPQVYVAPALPVYTQPVYQRHVRVVTQPVYTTTYAPGRIYYIQGHPYLNGHPYRGHGKNRHHDRHGHGKGHGHGNGHGHGSHGGHR